MTPDEFADVFIDRLSGRLYWLLSFPLDNRARNAHVRGLYFKLKRMEEWG